jgi:D-galactarolactone cycloisomerase
LEEPFSRGDIFLYNHLRGSVPNLPFAGGEGEKSLFGYEKLIKTKSLDIIQTDPTMIGGFTMSKKVAEMTKEHGKLFVGHMWGTRLGSITLAHVSATLSEEEAPWQEHPLFTTDDIQSMYPFPLANEILREPLDIKSGYLKMPKGPGLGVDIDEKALEKYQFVPGRWTFYVPPASISY